MIKLFKKRKKFSEEFDRMNHEFNQNRKENQQEIEAAKKEFAQMEKKFGTGWNITQKK